jgi:hypothetical protein
MLKRRYFHETYPEIPFAVTGWWQRESSVLATIRFSGSGTFVTL